MNLKFCRIIKSKEVRKPISAESQSTQTAKSINSDRHFDEGDSSETDEYIQLTVGQLIIGVFAFTFIVALTLMQCLVLEPTKTIVKHVIEIMLFAIVLPFFALTCIAMMVIGCAGIVYTCKDLCENESDIEQV